METALLVALVSLGGVLLSALISWIVSKQRVDAEIQKVRYDLQRSYAETLHKSRLQAYPPVYASLESFSKAIQKKQATLSELQAFYQSIDRWHTGNGHLLGAETNGVFYVFLRRLGQICVSGWRTHLENGDSVGDDGVHQGFRWTPWNTPSALGGVTMTS